MQPSIVSSDLVFENGLIYTVNDDNLWAQAVAINNGMISFVGSESDVQGYIGDDTVVIDLKGQLMLPRIHDVHLHILEASSPFAGDCILDD